jgi:hypothetical protein
VRGIGGGRIDNFFNKENEKVSLNRLLSDTFYLWLNKSYTFHNESDYIIIFGECQLP